MKYVLLSVVLVLAVGLANAASISTHLQEEWELFKATNTQSALTHSYCLIICFNTENSW